MDLSFEGVLVLEFPKKKRIPKIVWQHKEKDDKNKDFFSILFSLKIDGVTAGKILLLI
jgi:hypothetical protein